MLVWLLILMAYLASNVCQGEEPQPTAPLERFVFVQRQMGMEFHLIVYAPGEKAANDAADAVYSRVRELNEIFSDYQPESELNFLCKQSGNRPGEPVPVSSELCSILRTSLALSKKSDGAFDVTVGPLIKLWRQARKARQLPSAEDLAAARKLVGYQGVVLDEKSHTVTLTRPGMQLNLGGIAAGYAIDEAGKILRERGLHRYLIDASGDILCGEPPPGKPGWTVGVAPLPTAESPPSRYLTLKNQAVSTSGDAYQFVEIDGQRYSHIIDPATGLGLTRSRSVILLAPTGIASDAWATLVSVVGPERGLKLLAKEQGLEALILEGSETPEQPPTVLTSPGFPQNAD